MTVRLVIFDLDGTLVDSQRTIVNCAQTAFEALGLPKPDPEAIRRIVGLSLIPAMRQVMGYEDQELAKRIAAAYREAYIAYRESDQYDEALFDGAREVLEELNGRELLLGVATGKAMRGVNAFIERYGLHGTFVTLQTSDLHPSKPHPSMLEAAMRETGTDPHETVFVGDTTYDVQMAVSSGVLPVGVSWGNHPSEELLGAGARSILEKFQELLPIIDAS